MASQDRGIHVVYDIYTVASLLVSTEGPTAALESGTSQYTLAEGQSPPDVGHEDHGLSFLGGAHPGGNVGLVSPVATLGKPYHSHTCRRRPSIHRDDSSTEGC